MGLILGRNFLWWKFSGWELSGGNHPGGNFPGESFYVTIKCFHSFSFLLKEFPRNCYQCFSLLLNVPLIKSEV